MGNSISSLKAVDRIEVTTVMDNYADALLPGSEIVKRPPHVIEGAVSQDTLVAEHGLCLLVSVFQGSEKTSILFDAGYSKIGVLHNVEQLGIDLGETTADNRFTLLPVTCLGACDKAPVMMVGDTLHEDITEPHLLELFGGGGE